MIAIFVIILVTYIALALSLFCLVGILVMAYWARSVRRLRTSPPPPPFRQPPTIPPRPSRSALDGLTSFALRRQQEREISRHHFNMRNTAFQRELAERLEQVRCERRQRYPGTPRNTPDPVNQANSSSQRSTRQSTPTPNIPSTSYSTSSSFASSTTTTPIMSRSVTPPPPSIPHTPLLRTREPTPAPPTPHVQLPPANANLEHIYDSPNDSIYESISNSPVTADNSEPPSNNLPPLPSIPPQSKFSSFGRLLKRTSFFKSNP